MNQEKRKHLNGLSGAFQSLEWEDAISFNVTIDFHPITANCLPVRTGAAISQV